MPEELQVQMPYLKQVANLLGICDMELDTFEADDLTGTVAHLAQKENYEVFYSQMFENLEAFKKGKPIRVIQMLN